MFFFAVPHSQYRYEVFLFLLCIFLNFYLHALLPESFSHFSLYSASIYIYVCRKSKFRVHYTRDATITPQNFSKKISRDAQTLNMNTFYKREKKKKERRKNTQRRRLRRRKRKRRRERRNLRKYVYVCACRCVKVFLLLLLLCFSPKNDASLNFFSLLRALTKTVVVKFFFQFFSSILNFHLRFVVSFARSVLLSGYGATTMLSTHCV